MPPRAPEDRRRRPSRRALDEWFGTVCHYSGLGLLAYSALVDRFENPALLPAAMGLICLPAFTSRGRGE